MTDVYEQLQLHWEDLIRLGVVSSFPPPGVGLIPPASSPWRILDLGVEAADRFVYVHAIVASAIQARRDLSPLIADLELLESFAQAERRSSRRRALLVWSILLPIALVAAIPFRARPGSLYTSGMAVAGFIAFLAIPGLVFALLSRQWELAGLCVYWWAGTKVVESDYRKRGLIP